MKILYIKIIKSIYYSGAILLFIFIGYNGIVISLKREVHDAFNRDTKFSEYLSVSKLKYLRWGCSTLIEGVDITAQSVNELVMYLESIKNNFFIFPDFSIFYGLLNVKSPQPLLWFHKGLTYPHRYDSKLDEWIVNSLKKNNVGIIIIEEKSFFGTELRLKDFPLLREYIEDNFQETKKIGIFKIFAKYEKRES